MAAFIDAGIIFEKHPCMNFKSSDRSGIYLTHEIEIRDLAKKLRFPIDDILSAVQEVGFNEDEIVEYIRDRHERSL